MYLLFLLIAPIIFLADQGSKALVRANIPLGESVDLIPGKLTLTHVRNKGAANGLFSNNRKALMFFSAIAVISDILTFFDLRRHYRHCKAAWLMYAMHIGGGASNLFDRLTKRPTIDYLQLCPRKKTPVFNIADIFILIGAVGLIIIYLKMLILPRES